MDTLFVGFVMSLSLTTLLLGVSSTMMRRIMGHKKLFNIILHFSVLYIVLGTGGDTIVAAECAAIMLSIWIWMYSLLLGYSRREAIPQFKIETITKPATRKGRKPTTTTVKTPIKPRFWHPHKWVEYPGVLSKWMP